MKVLRLGLGAALIAGILLFSSAILLGRGKQAQEINLMVVVPTKGLYETPQVISSAVTTSTDTADVVNTPGVPDVTTTMLTGTTDIPTYPDAREVEPYGGPYYHTPGGMRTRSIAMTQLTISSAFTRENWLRVVGQSKRRTEERWAPVWTSNG